MKRYLALCSLLVLGVRCGQSPQTESDAVSLQPIRVISLEETDSLFLGDFGSITLTSNPFRLYIPDGNVHRISVFDSLGNIVRFFGSEGQGPGELWRPMKIVVDGDHVYVKESDRVSVFDTTGNYLRTMRLPIGIYTEDRWSLNYFEDRFYLAAVDVSQRTGNTIRATPKQNTIAILDSTFEQVEMTGHFPAFYQQGEYNNRWRHLDISPSGLMAVCYSLLPDVYLYDLRKPDRPLVRTLPLSHSEFRQVKQELPVQMPISEIRKNALEISTTLTTWIVKDSLVVLVFANRDSDYYENIGSDQSTHYYGIVASVSGRQLGTLVFPGPVLGRDKEGYLYIRLSNVPDERKIGVYEVVVS